MPVLLSSALHAQLLNQAHAAHPLECCGLLFGDGTAILRVQPTANVAQDPAQAFEIDPAALIAAERNTRSGGEKLMGHYHSHPNGRADPSPQDASSAAGDGRLWLIVAQAAITAWRAVPGGPVHGAFEPVKLTITR